MSAPLEIIIPVRDGNHALPRTTASLLAQTDRRFAVLLSDDYSTVGVAQIEEAQSDLSAAGIAVRRLRPPRGLKRIEHWNWAHAQSHAAWLKLLLPGEQLKPAYVERLGRSIRERAHARFIRCDVELQTEWGPAVERAPFPRNSIGAAEVADYFPRQLDWISRSLNVACERTAWAAAGGYARQLPSCAVLNFNLIQALHHGVENLAEPLAFVDSTERPDLNTNGAGRVNSLLEMWLILRQGRNFSQAAKLPWRRKWLLAAAFSMALSR
jgi:glycosyltransferase involved in cell wall biosynthesis